MFDNGQKQKSATPTILVICSLPSAREHRELMRQAQTIVYRLSGSMFSDCEGECCWPSIDAVHILPTPCPVRR